MLQYQRWLPKNFDLYQGKNPRTNKIDEILHGKAVILLMQETTDDKKNLPFRFHLDNRFTSNYLLKNTLKAISMPVLFEKIIPKKIF